MLLVIFFKEFSICICLITELKAYGITRTIMASPTMRMMQEGRTSLISCRDGSYNNRWQGTTTTITTITLPYKCRHSRRRRVLLCLAWLGQPWGQISLRPSHCPKWSNRNRGRNFQPNHHLLQRRSQLELLWRPHWFPLCSSHRSPEAHFQSFSIRLKCENQF